MDNVGISPSRKWKETENNRTPMNHEFYLFFHKNIDKKYKKLYSENIKFLTFFGNFKEVAYESL